MGKHNVVDAPADDTAPVALSSWMNSFAEVSLIALLANLPQRFIRCGSGQVLAGMKYPNAVFFCERPRPTDRTQGDLFSRAFHLQGVAWFQMQLFAYPLWNQDAASFIHG
jgi:hypothetical protein